MPFCLFLASRMLYGMFNRLEEMYAVVWSLELTGMLDSNLFLLVSSFGELGSFAVYSVDLVCCSGKNTFFLMTDLLKHRKK